MLREGTGARPYAFRGVKTLLPKAIKPAVPLEAAPRNTVFERGGGLTRLGTQGGLPHSDANATGPRRARSVSGLCLCFFHFVSFFVFVDSCGIMPLFSTKTKKALGHTVKKTQTQTANGLLYNANVCKKKLCCVKNDELA